VPKTKECYLWFDVASFCTQPLAPSCTCSVAVQFFTSFVAYVIAAFALQFWSLTKSNFMHSCNPGVCLHVFVILPLECLVYPVPRLLVSFRNMVFLLDDVECELVRTCETHGGVQYVYC
jgi:hypothetical protein